MFQTLGFFCVLNPTISFLQSLQSEVCEDDDDEDDAVETPRQHPVGTGKCLQGVFVEEGKKWFCSKW